MEDDSLLVAGQLQSYRVNPCEENLVNELWALQGRCDRKTAEGIAERARLPLKWIDTVPARNGEKGMDKLLAERGVLLLRNRTSPFIEQFGHPIGRCAKFYKLTAYNNCNFWCEYCYLYLTFRTNPVSTHFVNYEKMFKEIVTFDESDIPDSLRVLNLGELCDPLAVEHVTGFAEKLILFAAEHTTKTKLLFLTKGADVESLLHLAHGGKSIMSFSVNTDRVYRRLEHRTARPEARMTAARHLQKAGYEIRLRIDPIIIYEGWQKEYEDLVDAVFRHVTPARITLGEYRPSKGLVSHIESRFPGSPLLDITAMLINDGVKLRYPEKKRVAVFRAIIDKIKQHYPEMRISLCKENPAIWKQAGIDAGGLYCNCVG
jgi:spore photoproduct lyase